MHNVNLWLTPELLDAITPSGELLVDLRQIQRAASKRPSVLTDERKAELMGRAVLDADRAFNERLEALERVMAKSAVPGNIKILGMGI